MTKTLTEQWRDGTLRGCFYWKLPNGNICTAYTDTMRDIKKVRDSDEVEVLQETPSHVEYNELKQDNKYLKSGIETRDKQIEQLEKRLKIATKALKGVCVWANTGNGGEQAVKKVCEKALKEMEGVK